MTVLEVRPMQAARRGTTRYAVEVGGQCIASVELSRRHRALERPPDQGTGPHPPARGPDPAAWTDSAASRAAASRWRDPHPAIRSVSRIVWSGDTAGRLPAAVVLEAVGSHVAEAGVRRLDLRVGRAEPIVAELRGARWVSGPVDDDVVASLAISHPWIVGSGPGPQLEARIASFPPRVRRAIRRVASMHPRLLPDLVRTSAVEVWVAARRRSRAGSARSRPAAGAPKGSHPFAASRYRTVRNALSFVPPALRQAPLLDIGSGDGRVLREALDAGFAAAHGRELDEELARKAQDLIGDAGVIEVGDALATPLPDDVQVLFLNNPFDSAGLGRFAGLVADTLKRRPRPLLVLYLNPRPLEPLLDAGLVLVEVAPPFSVLASAEDP